MFLQVHQVRLGKLLQPVSFKQIIGRVVGK
jgi:hypothetical protein